MSYFAVSLSSHDDAAFPSRQRNYMLESHRKDQLIEWMKGMLYHSFVLNATSTYADTMSYFEELINEYRINPSKSRLNSYVPSLSTFHTGLELRRAFELYNEKYRITARKHIPPSFNEIRHILNLAQVMSIGTSLSILTFDGDQTLYVSFNPF